MLISRILAIVMLFLFGGFGCAGLPPDKNIEFHRHSAKLLGASLLTGNAHVSDGTSRMRNGKRRFSGELGANAITYKGYQYAVFYSGKNRNLGDRAVAKVVVARRPLEGQWVYAVLQGYNLKSEDAHNRPEIEISRGDGVIHIAFDHHNSETFHYAHTLPGVADKPEAFAWDQKVFTYLPNLGLAPDTFMHAAYKSVTYPSFLSTPNGNLVVYYRGGGAVKGALVIGKYDASKHKWVFTKKFSTPHGKYLNSDLTRGPYTSGGVQIGPDQQLMVAWVWREKQGGPGCYLQSDNYRKCTHGLYFAKSPDEGVSWYNDAGALVADANSGKMISINNIGPPVVDVPGSLEPSNVGNTSAMDAETGDMHVMLPHKENTNASTYLTHHYTYSKKDGTWRGQPSSFNAESAQIFFLKDGAIALTGRSEAAVYFAKRNEHFKTWYPLGLPLVPTSEGPKEIKEGFVTWDTGRLKGEGIASLMWQLKTPDIEKGVPSPIWVYNFQIIDPYVKNAFRPDQP